MEPRIQFFVCFHREVYQQCYEITDRERELITFYGVKARQPVERVIYEDELSIYNPNLQRLHYNESSCLYHVYKNRLYEKYDYVGFCQYDMVFHPSIFSEIKASLQPNTIFYLDFFKWAFKGGQTTIIRDYKDVTAGLVSYNKFFNTAYRPEDLIANKMPICNTFLVSRDRYAKMMIWMEAYFIETIEPKMSDPTGLAFDPGHMIEALTSMFLALEVAQGAVYRKLPMVHNNELKLPPVAVYR